MVLLAAYAGLRVSEIAAIRGEDIDMIINSISILGKGGKRRHTGVPPLAVPTTTTEIDRHLHLQCDSTKYAHNELASSSI